MGAKVNLRQTLLLPLILPPDTVVQLLPFQYCTSNPVRPKLLNVIASVGSEGYCQLSCPVKTSISSMVLLPLKSICSQSGKVFAGGLSFQPSPLPQPTPLRLPLFVPAGVKFQPQHA